MDLAFSFSLVLFALVCNYICQESNEKRKVDEGRIVVEQLIIRYLQSCSSVIIVSQKRGKVVRGCRLIQHMYPMPTIF